MNTSIIKLVDYILGKRARPPSPKQGEEKIDMPIPSYFGINRDKAENKYLGLHSKSSFINKGDNICYSKVFNEINVEDIPVGQRTSRGIDILKM